MDFAATLESGKARHRITFDQSRELGNGVAPEMVHEAAMWRLKRELERGA